MSANAETGEVTDDVDFATFLATVRPDTSDELGAKLRDLVRAVKATGKAGSVSLTVKIEPLGVAVEVTDTIRVNIPDHDRGESIAYPDAGANLKTSDPNAFPMFNREDAS